MSWLFSQALVEAFSADTCSDGEPFAQLNVMPMPQPFWRNDKTMEPSRFSRFGVTSALLTADRGADLLTWFRADFLARTSAPQEMAQALTAHARDSGVKWLASSVRYDRATSSWRTHLCLWDEALPWSSVILPKWGSMQSGLVLRHLTSERPINATACGLLPTPLASNTKAHHMRSGGRPARSYWPTPRTTGLDGGSNSRKAAKARGMWPTPTASLGAKGGRVTPRKSREGGTLIEAVSDRMFATPTARDWKSGHASEATMKKNSRPLSEQIGGQLNPTWVEWLMGWPTGWTDLKPLEMDKFREWRQQHGVF